MVDSVKRVEDSVYKGSIAACVRKTLAEEGVQVLYRGCLLNAFKSAPAFALTATLNDALKASMCGIVQ